MATKLSLLCSQEHVTGTYAEPEESNLHSIYLK